MSISQDLQRAILAKPGMTFRESAAAIGKSSRKELTTVSALLSDLSKRDKLRAEAAGGKAATYWPTAHTCTDNRTLRKRPGTKHEREAERKRLARAAKRDTPVAAPSYSSPKATRPGPASQIRVAPLLRLPAPPRGAAQTVAEFEAMGGQIQRLDPHASSNPLRYDHSNTTTPIGRRRASIRPRKAGAP